jgi:hypothetical protein
MSRTMREVVAGRLGCAGASAPADLTLAGGLTCRSVTSLAGAG